MERAFPFTSARKRSSIVVHRRGTPPDQHKYRVFVKGASEVVLRLCNKALNASSGHVEGLTGDFNFNEDGGVSGDGVKAMIARDVINRYVTVLLCRFAFDSMLILMVLFHSAWLVKLSER